MCFHFEQLSQQKLKLLHINLFCYSTAQAIEESDRQSSEREMAPTIG